LNVHLDALDKSERETRATFTTGAGGFVPGVYVGANAILNGAQLFNALKFQHFWKSGSIVPQIPVRGYQMIQTIPGHATTVDGIALHLDLDLTHTDALGGHVQWLTLP
jgi:hypothetical protein